MLKYYFIEGDGVDYCAVVSCLTQLLVDPYFRTISGFQSLIQKEWIALGHPFCDRCDIYVFLHLFIVYESDLVNKLSFNNYFVKTFYWTTIHVTISFGHQVRAPAAGQPQGAGEGRGGGAGGARAAAVPGLRLAAAAAVPRRLPVLRDLPHHAVGRRAQPHLRHLPVQLREGSRSSCG